MSVTAKRELESPSADSASKRRRHGMGEGTARGVESAQIDPTTNTATAAPTTNGEGPDTREGYSNPKNLLQTGSLSSSGSAGVEVEDAYQHTRTTMTLLLAPCDVSDAVSGISRQLDDVLWTYLAPARGILMGWRDVRVEGSCGRVLEESPFTAVRVSLDTLVWRPRRDEVVQGRVTFQGPSHIGFLLLGTFNASVPVHLIPPSWSFHHHHHHYAAAEDGARDGEGHWVSHDGQTLSLNQILPLRTVGVKKGANILSVEGSLLDLPSPSPSLHAAVAAQDGKDDGAAQGKREPDAQAVTTAARETPVLRNRDRKAEKERRRSEKRARRGDRTDES
ncbi:protein of unknown function [Taphrina deformans PYCC 5710]|uniref:DNA-directed RNA polymerase subunit n=1 Tax=Taphrina deformans (strain PYCC 5710 / ATCC 11124 / CBS 356.35 / IMI 108563 / JCM 9778 / NBRC 8474) TaxID=1097556 RepID=R4XDG9_TAPDE|nr:protein of unknown function [Taphrina deformans PYCC 5710]|eukprot:CCG83885.1 protein of unknown function [Taphrina deformans PYCC 5710]